MTMDEREKLEQDVRRIRGEYGPNANIPLTPYGQMMAGPAMPVMPEPSAAEQLAKLCQQVAETGAALDLARMRQREAAHELGLCEGRFAKATDELQKAMTVHRGDGKRAG